MILPIKRVFQNATAAVNVLFGVSRQVDYKALNRYILSINQGETLENILQEAASCLKEILNYQLFAFAVQNRGQLDAWIDPRIYRRPLTRVIYRDFGSIHTLQVHALGEQAETVEGSLAFRDQDLLSYSLMNGNGLARMYILPERQILAHHREILKIIVKTLGIALNNYLSIKQLEDDVALDPLTGCYNRREFDRLVGHHIANAKRYDRDFSLIMLDVDHFKKVNDDHGHVAGDVVLKALAASVLGAIRDGDYLARYGGEEFVVVLPNTRMPRAIELAKRLRQVIEALTITLPDGQKISKTASFGVATLRAGDDKDSLVKAADTMLYQAKASGRNRVMPNLYAVNDDGPCVALCSRG